MDIIASNGKFAIGLLCRCKYKFNDDDGTLSLWGGDTSLPLCVTTNRGDFLEEIDSAGNVVQTGGDGGQFWLHVGKKLVRLRFKKLPPLALSKTAIDKKRRIVTRYLVSDMPHNLKVPNTLLGAIAWLQKQATTIPARSRPKARVSFDTSMSYGETYPNLEITYTEPETDAEVILRLQIEAERARIREISERQQLAALQQRFPAA